RSISLSAPQPYKIYYTTDGSLPNLKSNLYNNPIHIQNREEQNVFSAIPSSPRWKPPIGNVFKGTVLRAIVVTEDNRRGPELIKTFFIDEKRSPRYTFPVIALTVNADDLFGHKNGIYVLGKNYEDKDDYIKKNRRLDLPWWEYPSNYLKRGDNAERPVHIEFFLPGTNAGFEANAGIRINGNATRGFSQKSLRICFNPKYGTDQIKFELFPDYPVNKFNSFILRNSGNDWDKTMFRDACLQTLFRNTKVDIQEYAPSVVFINGEYWGIHNIRERIDEHFIGNKYQITADSITILELGGELVKGNKKDQHAFGELLEYIQNNDMSTETNYAYVKARIDVESLTDFIIANVYFCNSDWPNNNVKFWRYQSKQIADGYFSRDGRWRWILYDMDWGCGYNSASTPQTNLLPKAAAVGSVGILFKGLLNNKTFAAYFVSRFKYHLSFTFNSQRVIAVINDFQRSMEPEIREHIDRWRVIGSYDQWLENIEVMRRFAKERPDYQVKQLNSFFNLKDGEQISL
ncbi:MAG TPA: CotH kinase family protein, partial [Bacteroidia bacterium]|nr:CotH kinase family protein [Bacteroidia bacterium]